jgi:hypothetical protein
LAACLLLSACLAGLAPVPAAHAAGEGLVTLEVEQSFTDSDPSSGADGTFAYRLVPEAAGSPMPAGGGAGGYGFAVTGTAKRAVSIDFSGAGAGIYTYGIRCVADARPGYTYDTRQYTVRVYLAGAGNAAVVVYAPSGGKAAAIAFSQGHKAVPPVPPDPEDPQTPDPPDPPVPPDPQTPGPPGTTPAGPTDPGTPPGPGTGPTPGGGVSAPPRDDATGTTGDYTPGREIAEGEGVLAGGFSERDLARLAAQTGNIFKDLLNGNVPLGGLFARGVWSLLSLIFAVLALAVAAFSVLSYLMGRRPGDRAREGYARERRPQAWAFNGILVLLGLLTLVLWLIFDDTSQPMVWIDDRTAVVAIPFIAQTVFRLLRGRIRPYALRHPASVE